MGPTDYRALCQEIFETDNEAAIRKLAASWKQKNSRNAGRKRALGPADLDVVDTMRSGGATVQAIADHFGVSRPVISQYLNGRPDGDYTLRMDFRLGDKTCTVIYVDFDHRRVAIQNRTEDPLHRAFGVNEAPTWEDLQQFLASRCFPKSRGYAKAILRGLGIDSYDPLQIVEATGGRTAEDEMYLTFRTIPREVKPHA